MQTITVCTDAGHTNFYKQSVAVWASYMRTPSQTIHISGIIGQPCKGSSQAEIYAIANALYILDKRYDLSKYRIILYADSLYALENHVDGTLGKKNQEHIELYNKYLRPYINKMASFEARHVKAHLPKNKWGPNTARFFMQNWCDEEVHRLMKIARKLLMDKINQK